MATYKIHERIVELLQAEGIDTIFGIPDPSFFAMFMTAEQRGLRVVAPHHEQAGALMADGLYRMTGKPGVLGVDLGACNAYTRGVEAASAVSCPALFLLGAADRMTPAKAGKALATRIKNSEVIVLPGIGHMVMTEAPDATVDALAIRLGSRAR